MKNIRIRPIAQCITAFAFSAGILMPYFEWPGLLLGSVIFLWIFAFPLYDIVLGAPGWE